MDREKWQKVNLAWDQYSELPPAEQAAFLDRLRREDREVFDELESLRNRHEKSKRINPDDLAVDWKRELRLMPGENEMTSSLEDSPPHYLFSRDEHQPTPSVHTPSSMMTAGYEGSMPLGLREYFGRYRIEKLLGEGGMGTVFLAQDTRLKRKVALKVPKLTEGDHGFLRSCFLREAQAAAALHHPHICPIFDFGEIEGTLYLTMPYIEGQTLWEKVTREGPLPIPLAVTLVHKVALALQEAHNQGVIHRDLKPNNILLDQKGEPVVMDFGLARRSDPSSPQVTASEQVLGTPAYMSPEQVSADKAALGPACDIYSLGVVLYELLAGVKPFEGNMVSLLERIVSDPPPPPSQKRPELGLQFDAFCLKALAKRPQDRWRSMEEFAQALGAFLPTNRLCVEESRSPTQLPDDAPIPSQQTGLQLILRVKNTSYCYRPTPHQERITVGRQRRKVGGASDQGNDFVIRVENNEPLSLRVSRRHFEIQREGEEFLVVDRSKHGLVLNGKSLSKNTPTPLQNGDSLIVAGVLELEVILQEETVQPAGHPLPQVRTSYSGNQVMMEVSLGDLITME